MACLTKKGVTGRSGLLLSFFNIRNEHCMMLLQPTVFASGIGPEDPFGKLRTGGAVVEKIPSGVGIAQVHMRRKQRIEGIERRGMGTPDALHRVVPRRAHAAEPEARDVSVLEKGK